MNNDKNYVATVGTMTEQEDKPLHKWLIIDIETLGDGLDAAIFSVAALNHLGESIHYQLDIDVQMAEGAKITASTIEWWLRQPAVEWLDDCRMCEDDDLQLRLNALYHGGHVWCRGTDFDLPILGNLFVRSSACLSEARDWHKWHYAAVRDVRTAEGITGKHPCPKRSHNPLDDCHDAAYIVQKYYEMTA